MKKDHDVLFLLLLSMGFLLLFSISCSKEDVSSNSFTDSRDGTVYKTVTIGNQVWMAENLRYLPSVVDASTGSNTTPYYYVFDYSGNNVSDAKATKSYTTYGVLYNWPAAMGEALSSSSNPSNVQGVCPDGWHLPSDAEWSELVDFLGGASIAGGKLKETGSSHWISPNVGATNETNFTALPGGYRSNFGAFFSQDRSGCWWSATAVNLDSAMYRATSYSFGEFGSYSYVKEDGYSVRCVKD